MSQIRIVITRKDGDLGFSMKHEGIYAERRTSSEPYEGGFGTVKGLRESLMDLLDAIENNDLGLVAELRHMSANEALPMGIRNQIIEELNRWDRAVEANRREKEVAANRDRTATRLAHPKSLYAQGM